MMAPNMMPDEKDLLQQLRDGNQTAFEAIYRKYSLTIYANILRMIKDETEAADLLQDVFLKIWENRASIDPEKSFKGYLFTCSKFLVLNFLRHISIERQLENYLAYTRSERYDPVEEAIFSKETEAFLRQTIAQLPPQRQKIYNLCKIEGMTYEQVATQLGISTSTVKEHIVKANRFIKERIAKANAAVWFGVIFNHLIQ